MIGSTHIQITNTHRQGITYKVKPTIGAADILHQLLPKLCVNESRAQYQPITGLDHYMRQETEHLLARIETHCEMVLEAMSVNTIGRETPTFTLRYTNDKCQLDGQYPQGLLKKLNQDSWLMDAFAWLLPNYLTLVHSLELVAFSYIYKRSRSKATKTYRHFDNKNNGLVVSVTFATGKAQWNITSPINVYHL
ncbi:hypothetical protein [Paraglaciecola sp. 20A4]|uniref:hypothetical protein n=1 Tax=Paraglaciecola sp. 20A4 TaxID=2687288 RepID=UPI00140C5E46|nr:hypothetical protein [Paraglaciecola sp. 20A4]